MARSPVAAVRSWKFGPYALPSLRSEFDQQEGGRKPDRPAPVRVAALQLAGSLGRLVTDHPAVQLEGLRFVRLGEAANAVVRQELARVIHAVEETLKLVLIDDGEHVCQLAVGLLRLVDHAIDDAGPVAHEPVQARGELLELLNPIDFQPLHREQRDQADERPDAELAEPAVGVAQHVVEEAVLLIP